MKLRAIAAAVIAMAIGVGGAAAAGEQMTSAYSSLSLERDCSRIAPPPGTPDDEAARGAEWWCDGYGGTAVRVTEGDLRFYLGYGRGADEQCARTQTLGAFNTIGETLEWRLRREFPGHLTPVATILRYRTDVDGHRGQYLVVTRLDRDQACHMAYVDVGASRDANALARRAADRHAAGFDCTRDTPFMMTWDGPRHGETPGAGRCRRND